MIDEKCAVHIGHIFLVMADLSLPHSLNLLEKQGELEDLALPCIAHQQDMTSLKDTKEKSFCNSSFQAGMDL